jgi:D-alanyl-D-alanine carboxypeptidase/D-alanyl-D-alanine-endopeptidase (penicillin-binding protein 4)
MLKPMMHRSDNFFAEQTLLMVGYKLTGIMNSGVAAEAVTRDLLAGMPHKARWVDGSGLSRYNLFTPADLVWVLDKMKREIAWERLKEIFPTGGKGTLRSYVADSGRLYAKTGTLSGVIALSGYVITKKNKTLIFSIMINNHQVSNAVLRSRMGAFLGEIIEKY